jgi:hypothetical protein
MMRARHITGRGFRGDHEGRGSRGSREATNASAEQVSSWLVGRLPDAWFEGSPTVTIDRDEVLVVGRLSAPDVPADAQPADRAAAESGRVTRFREETREERMTIAREVEHRFERTLSWGAEVGDTTQLFTVLSVPVMTRLRQPERMVLDTLVDSGVARSRSDALAWCVKLVAANTEDWLKDLRQAMGSVETVRQQGPKLT